MILPDGVEEWAPEEAGSYEFHVIPYTVTLPNHPCDIPVGKDWNRRPVKVHYNLGPDNKARICPTSFGKKCPICEELPDLYEDYDDNKERIGELRPSKMTAFLVVGEGEDKVAAFLYSDHKFANVFLKELDIGEPINMAYDDPDTGKMIRVRFAEEKWNGRTYLKADRIDFVDREPIPDEWLEQSFALDECFVVPTYQELDALWRGLDETEVIQQDTPFDEDEDKEDDKKPKVKKEDPPERRPGKPTVKKEDPPKAKPKAKKEPEPIDDDDIPEGCVRCVACEGTKVNTKGATCQICDGDGFVEDKDNTLDAVDEEQEDDTSSDTNSDLSSIDWGDDDWG